MTTSSKIKAIDEAARFEDRDVRLADLGLAPENPRAKEGADDGIPHWPRPWPSPFFTD